MPLDNGGTVAPGQSVLFPRAGPHGSLHGITVSASGNPIQLAAIGTYLITFQVSITEPGQLVLALNGAEQTYTVAGRATGTSQIMNTVILSTTTINSSLSVNNPSANVSALTITLNAGGNDPVSAHVVIIRLV
jgi:hypothetical protein